MGWREPPYSFGMSIAIVPLIGLMLNYTLWGIRLEPVLYSVSLFIFIASAVAKSRRRRLPEGERFVIEFQPESLGWNGGQLNKALSIILVISILGTLTVLGYVVAFPKVGEKFPSFIFSGQTAKRLTILRNSRSERRLSVTVGVVNHEQRTVSYPG